MPGLRSHVGGRAGDCGGNLEKWIQIGLDDQPTPLVAKRRKGGGLISVTLRIYWAFLCPIMISQMAVSPFTKRKLIATAPSIMSREVSLCTAGGETLSGQAFCSPIDRNSEQPRITTTACCSSSKGEGRDRCVCLLVCLLLPDRIEEASKLSQTAVKKQLGFAIERG